MGLGRTGKADSLPLTGFIGPEKLRSRDGPVQSIFPRSPAVLKTSAKRFRAKRRMASPSPFSPLASFGSVVAVRSRGCRPSGFLPGDRLLVFSNRVADCSRGRWRRRAFGEGLGGGYCTPPNRTRRERSELLMLHRSRVIHSQKVIHRRGVFGYLILDICKI